MLEGKVNITGRCLCGGVEVTASQASKSISACHCGMCRRWTGGALLLVDCGEQVSIKGGDYIALHQTSAVGERAFCAECGSGLYYHYFDNGHYFVPAGLFEFDGFSLDQQIFIDEKPPYYQFSSSTIDSTGKEFCQRRHGADTIEVLDNYRT